ncbi:MAG: hypothetical protein MZU97_26605 [Bacillus subtilis]|nr:hypothetical protein [Bacillus subtilis]
MEPNLTIKESLRRENILKGNLWMTVLYITAPLAIYALFNFLYGFFDLVIVVDDRHDGSGFGRLHRRNQSRDFGVWRRDRRRRIGHRRALLRRRRSAIGEEERRRQFHLRARVFQRSRAVACLPWRAALRTCQRACGSDFRPGSGITTSKSCRRL